MYQVDVGVTSLPYMMTMPTLESLSESATLILGQ